MANKNVKGITIEFQGNTTKLERAMKNVRKESSDIDKELRAVNKALKFNPDNVKLLAQKEELLTDKIKQSKSQLEQFKSIQSQLSSQGIDKNTSEWRELEREIIQTESKLKHFEGSLDQLQNNQSVATLQKKMETLGGKMNSLGRGMQNAGIGASAGAAGAIMLGKQWVDSAQVQLEAEDKLIEAYKSHVKGGEEAARSTMEFASSLQKAGVVGDEITIAGAGVLSGYTDNANNINKLLPVMDNLLVKQKGLNGTTSDAEGIAKSLGKALTGNAAAFNKLGVSLTDEQKEAFKTMDENERLAFIIEQITRTTGDMNAEFAKTDLGQLQQAQNTIGDLGEEAGKILLPALADIAKFLSAEILPKVEEFMNMVEAHPVIGKIAVGIVGLLAVAGPLLMFIGSIISIVGTLLPILAGLELAELATLWPILAIIAAIGLAIAAGVAIYKNWDKIKEKALELGKAVKDGVMAPFNKAKDIIKKAVEWIKGLFPIKIGNLLGKIKLPHFGIKPKGWKPSDLMKGSIPTLGVNWYKTGGIFNSPSVIGVGEGSSAEAVLPLDQFWSKMDYMTNSIASAMQVGMASQSMPEYIQIVVELGGTKVGEQIVRLYDKTKKAVG